MLYDAYEWCSDATRAMGAFGGLVKATTAPWRAGTYGEAASWVWAAAEMMSQAGLTHERPPYDITSVSIGNREVPVTERVAARRPFGVLTHFAKDDVATRQPKVLVVAPLSGHFATLLRNTVQTLVADHDVYITDWVNARDVPVSEGPFGFDDYVDHLVGFIETLGENTHVVAVCQPAVQALAAAALMNETRNPSAPSSITLMAGPIDTRINPTKVNQLALSKPYAWFEQNMIHTVPSRHPGAGRRVYPGFVQLAAFMSMNLDRHMKSHVELYWHLVNAEDAKANQVRSFYDEYFAVLDLAAEFYLETIKRVFQDNDLGRNALTYRGRPLDMRAVKRTALMTVEGERDDICSVGQTVAAHDLCTSLRPYMKRHHLQPGVGHYGVFSGRKWQGQVYPLVRNFILAND